MNAASAKPDESDTTAADASHGSHLGAHSLPATDPLRTRIADAVRKVRSAEPLAQSFTNFVTINLVANAQLAAGGTAAMSFLPDDVLDTAAISGAEYLNVGTLLPFYADALPQIARGLRDAGKHWVLDPVAAGIGATRTSILRSFRAAPPTVVRANASETIALADMWDLGHAHAGGDVQGLPAVSSRPAGVESVDDVESAAPSAAALARFLTDSRGSVAAVAVSGPVDLVTDGRRNFQLPGGSALMRKITGTGCALGGVMATYLAVNDPLTAALAASLHFNRAAEKAQQHADGPGSFQVALLDALWNTTAEQIAASPITIGTL